MLHNILLWDHHQQHPCLLATRPLWTLVSQSSLLEQYLLEELVRMKKRSLVALTMLVAPVLALTFVLVSAVVVTEAVLP